MLTVLFFFRFFAPQLAASDPIRRINAVEYVRSHLQRIIMVVGGQQRFQSDWLANVAADVIRSFGKLCVLGKENREKRWGEGL